MAKVTPKAARKLATPTHLKDLAPDPRNARKHNPKNIGMISDSLRAVGAGRSIVIDEHNEILAGNGLCEAAAEAGITKVQVVDADGDTIMSVWSIGKDAAGDYEHATQKPVALPVQAIESTTLPGGIVYDPFGGSGTVTIAAEQLGRACCAIELTPPYCQVAIDRWEAFTGQKAVKVGSA